MKKRRTRRSRKELFELVTRALRAAPHRQMTWGQLLKATGLNPSSLRIVMIELIQSKDVEGRKVVQKNKLQDFYRLRVVTWTHGEKQENTSLSHQDRYVAHKKLGLHIDIIPEQIPQDGVAVVGIPDIHLGVYVQISGVEQVLKIPFESRLNEPELLGKFTAKTTKTRLGTPEESHAVMLEKPTEKKPIVTFGSR